MISQRTPVRTVAGVLLVSATALGLATPGTALAKWTLYGIRTFKPPPSSLAGGFLSRPRAGGEQVERGRRALAASYPGAYRAHALAMPRPVNGIGPHASSISLYVGPGFPGLVDNGYYPADAQVAAGPSDIVEMTNTMVGIYTRTGFRLAEFPMTKILGTGNNDSLSDPQIAWDQTDGRWIATAMDETTDSTEISVSNTADPQGAWFNYGFAFSSRLCPDQPRLVVLW